MNPFAKSCGDRIRDLLDGGDPLDAVPEQSPERHSVEPCLRHLPLERKIERLGAAMVFLGDAIEEVRQEVKSLNKSNGIQNVDIAVLKTRAALYGGVAAAVVSPLVVFIVELILRHTFNW
jgi:hypothetical protein